MSSLKELIDKKIDFTRKNMEEAKQTAEREKEEKAIRIKTAKEIEKVNRINYENEIDIVCNKYITDLGIKEDLLEIGSNYFNGCDVRINDYLESDQYKRSVFGGGDDYGYHDRWYPYFFCGKKIKLSNIGVNLGVFLDEKLPDGRSHYGERLKIKNVPVESIKTCIDRFRKSIFNIKYYLNSGVEYNLSAKKNKDGTFDVVPEEFDMTKENYSEFITITKNKFRELSQEILSDLYVAETTGAKLGPVWSLMQKYKTNPEVKKTVKTVRETRWKNLVDLFKKS